MKFFVIGDAETVLGFALAGVDGEVVESKEEAQKALNNAFQIKEIGVVIITEKIAATIRSLVDQYIYKKSFPLIIEVPDRFGPAENRRNIKEMVSQAVGMQL